MALIDELKEKRADFSERMSADIKVRDESWERFSERIAGWEADIADLDRAIAALTPAPAPVEIEDSLAPEGMPQCAWETVRLTEAAPADEQDDASEFAQLEAEAADFQYAIDSGQISLEGLSDDDTPAEHISDLTGDPAIEPEAGLHEEAPALNSDMQDEREQSVEGYAPVVTPEAQMFSHGIQNEQKPKPDPRDWPFSHLFTGKPKVEA